jgi:NAD(P)-dependent dehydrogenase (short-subunit alcohol dehydrogenase family)
MLGITGTESSMINEQSYRTKVAVVTGGTMGIGRATALAFAIKGWFVAVLARGTDALASTKIELEAHSVRVLALSVDVSDAVAVNAAADEIERDLGPIEIWVNNAMATIVSPSQDITPDEFRRVTDVTYHGQVFGTLAALRHMKPRNRGAIVQVSSGLGIRSAPLQSAYCGAKNAVQGFTDSLRSELIHDGSKVSLTVVYLPAVNTPQFRRARNRIGHAQNAPDPVFDPRLCANAILAAAMKAPREVWVGRSTWQMAAVQAVAPGFGDRIAAKMWEAQVGSGPPPGGSGNLFDVDNADPGIDGPFTDRVKPSRKEFLTSRTRDAAVGGLGLLAMVGVLTFVAPMALAAGISRRRRH